MVELRIFLRGEESAPYVQVFPSYEAAVECLLRAPAHVLILDDARLGSPWSDDTRLVVAVPWRHVRLVEVIPTAGDGA